MDTIDRMLVPASPGGAPLLAARKGASLPPLVRVLWLATALLFVLGVGGLLNTPLPYYAIAPGDARQVNDLIGAPKDHLHPPDGRVYFATVSLQRVKLLGALRGWLDDDIDVVREEQILGDTPPSQYREQNLRLMNDSKETAMVVALRRLGYDVPEHGQGALVVSVLEGLPAHGRLASGDVITAVDGTPTPLVQEAVDIVRSHRPGDVLRFEVTDAKGATRVEEIGLVEREGRPILGVTMRTKDRTFDLPFEVTIDSGSVGGPSAGLAFALGLIDELSAGELTGGNRVAVTGTIEIDGRVGDVGGVVQKTAAVRAQGLQYFLVPPGEYEIARRHAGRNLNVVRVETLDDAIAALGRIGGDVQGLGDSARTAT